MAEHRFTPARWLCLLALWLAALPAAAQRALELDYLRQALPEALLSLANIEIAAVDQISKGSDEQGPHLGLRTYYGQRKKNNGVRAEVAIDVPFKPGHTLRYHWRFKIAADFVSDAPANRWWLFANWHDQPDRSQGETWRGFPSRSPPVALGYGQIEGRDQLALVYGSPDPRTVGLVPFKRGVWQTITLQITWSRGTQGQVSLYLNDAVLPQLQAQGPNMHNDFQHYIKIGQYRDPEIRSDAVLLIGGVQIERIGP